MKKDSYYRLAHSTQGEYKEKGSKFICHAFPIESKDDFEDHLQKLKNEHFKARHHCYAYMMGLDGEHFRANDDGEPNGSAGLPILNQLKSMGVTNSAAVVIRYFGGTKLGVSGLIRAYKTSTQLALEENSKQEKILSQIVRIAFDYSQMGKLMSTVKKLNLNVKEKSFEINPFVSLEIRKSLFQSKILSLKAGLLDISIEDYQLNEPLLEGYDFKELE